MTKLVDQNEISLKFSALEGWQQNDNKMCKNFVFKDFPSAMGWMFKCSFACEKLDHHPEWLNVYNRVFVSLTTHDTSCVTDKDLALAKILDENYISYCYRTNV